MEMVRQLRKALVSEKVNDIDIFFFFSLLSATSCYSHAHVSM